MQAVTGPLLEASAVRIDIDGASVVDGLSFASDGALILVQGAPRALFEAVCGIRSVARGTLRVLGQAPGRAAGAPLDPPIPAAWTARDYVLWSARLAGNKEAKEATERAMQALGLLAVARTRLGKLARVVRRAVVVASALATGAEVLVLEDPLVGLEDHEARYFGRALVKGLKERRTVVFALAVPLVSHLAMHADDAVVLLGSAVAAQGVPAELSAKERTCTLRVCGNVAAFCAALAERGASAVCVGEGEPMDMVVEQGSLSRTALVAVALEVGALVTSLRQTR